MFKKLIILTILSLSYSFQFNTKFPYPFLKNAKEKGKAKFIENTRDELGIGYIPPPFVPDMERRILMNNILLWGGIYPVVGYLAVPFILFFIPPAKEEGGSQFALDKYGNNINMEDWIKNNGYNSRNLVQGLTGDPSYLIVDNKEIKNFALNSICTHLGCVVPWVESEQKFMCPCHGSQYNSDGKVIRGPAPLPLKLEKVSFEDNQIKLSKWEEIDFRTQDKPWWI